MKKTFILKSNWIEIFDHLSDKQAGLLIKMLYHYNVKGERPAGMNDEIVNAYFNMMILDCKEFKDGYDARCESSSENGKKGGAPKGNTNARKQPKNNLNNLNKQNNPKDKDNVNDSPPYPPMGGGESDSDFADSENRNPYPSLTLKVSDEFAKYLESLDKPLNDYQCELKIEELMRLTDRPDEQLLILRHTTRNGWKKLVIPDDLGKAILDRRVAEELEEQKESKKQRDATIGDRLRKAIITPEALCET